MRIYEFITCGIRVNDPFPKYVFSLSENEIRDQ